MGSEVGEFVRAPATTAETVGGFKGGVESLPPESEPAASGFAGVEASGISGRMRTVYTLRRHEGAFLRPLYGLEFSRMLSSTSTLSSRARAQNGNFRVFC